MPRLFFFRDLLKASLCILTIILCAGPASAADKSTVSFQIVDELSDGQIDETIAVCINGLPTGQLHIDSSKPRDVLSVTDAAAASYRYTLCGQLLEQDADGKPQPHRIDHGGVLTGNIDVSELVALKSDNDVFYLFGDSLDDNLQALPFRLSGITAQGSCAKTVAMQ
jgi:hypothetical protein